MLPDLCRTHVSVVESYPERVIEFPRGLLDGIIACTNRLVNHMCSTVRPSINFWYAASPLG